MSEKKESSTLHPNDSNRGTNLITSSSGIRFNTQTVSDGPVTDPGSASKVKLIFLFNVVKAIVFNDINFLYAMNSYICVS